MFSREYSQYINRKYREAGSAIIQLAQKGLVHGEQDAQAFLKGISLIKDMKEEDFKKLQQLNMNQVKDLKEKAKSEENRMIGVAVHYLHKAMSMMSDAKYATNLSNAYYVAEEARQKEFHADNNTLFSNQVQLVQSVVNLVGEQVDLGYLASFNSVDARNARTVRVSDLLWQVRFTEIAKGESPELSGGADESTQDVTGKYYGAAVSFDDHDARFSPVTANAMLSAFRIKGEQILSHAAYKEIFRYDAAQSEKALINEYPSTANDDAMTERWRVAANARHTLNEGTADMIDAANHITAGNKKSTNKSEAPLHVPADSSIIVYYNHRNNSLLSDIQNTQMHTDLPNTELGYNYIFQPTAKAPISGAWQDDNPAIRDDHGTLGTVKEKSTKNHVGCKAVIPGYRNIAVTFQGLTIAQDRRNVNFSTIVAARQMTRHIVDNRQLSWIRLK